MKQKIIRIGNSLGIIFPKEIVNRAGFKIGKQVFVENDPNGLSVLIHQNEASVPSSLTPDFLKTVNDINKKYGPALKKLAGHNSQ